MPADVTHDALKTLRERTPRLLATLGVTASEADLAWLRTLDTRLLPRLSPDFPLIAAITGGGSAGKSTLFNSLVGAEISTAGGRAGLNRRVLVAVHPAQTARPDFLAELFLPFGAPPTPMGDRQVLTTPGPPVYVAQAALPRGVILLDTPDFDVGAAGAYLNRDVAAPVLSAADVLVYIFTNATYNAKANTDFIRGQLTAIGRRPCVLVYRVYQSYSEADVLAHAETVAYNLYGDDWREHVLAIFRADDDNAVAAGAAAMIPRRVGGGPGLLDTLSALDPRELRREQNGVMLADVARAAGATRDAARGERALLALYRDALRLATSHGVATALAELPLNRIVERIREVFEQTDPGFIRFSRRAGRVTGAPFRGLMRLVKGADPAAATPAVDPRELVRGSLIAAANTLRRQALGEEISAVTSAGDPDGASLIDRVAAVREARGLHGGERPLAEPSHAGGGVNLFIAAPPALDAARASLLARDWSAALARISEHASELLELPAALDAELASIVADFRRDLPFLKRARAALVASLNLVPPMLGIVYVFATADPVGGTSISAKLGSLFGLNDLWATVTIPASSGLDDLTRAHLKRLLDPVVQRWLATRAEPVGALLDAEVIGPVLSEATRRVDAADALLDAVTAALGRLPTGAPS
ncbi:MAG: hypothetical protein CVU56_20295 [Deltaproteobacteria bacterium HGW-Deltaproteobacteria-14]|jgi:hypothetical protein|nr:MAG: hypothetical protein CVU56_20295 [Deltaproteobacteria bacterium HGW-Deltaproteobacteria-14]